MNDVAPATLKVSEAIREFGDSQEPNQSPFQIAFNTKKFFWEFIENDKPRHDRFHASMEFLQQNPAFSPEHVLNGFDWHSLPKGSTAVDVGGSQGHLSIFLAKELPNINFIVEDLPGPCELGKKHLPANMASQITFQAHSFFEPQPISADIYFMRFILHDWPDAYCIKILNNLIPAMKTGSRVLVFDSVLPEPGSGLLGSIQERTLRCMDLQMMVATNARERTLSDWQKLIEKTDKRLHFTGFKNPPMSALSVIEIGFNPEA